MTVDQPCPVAFAACGEGPYPERSKGARDRLRGSVASLVRYAACNSGRLGLGGAALLQVVHRDRRVRRRRGRRLLRLCIDVQARARDDRQDREPAATAKRDGDQMIVSASPSLHVGSLRATHLVTTSPKNQTCRIG